MRAMIDDKVVEYTEQARWQVQVAKGPKGAYGTRWEFNASAGGQACMYYRGLNIGNGYKKRLLILDGGKKTILARCGS